MYVILNTRTTLSKYCTSRTHSPTMHCIPLCMYILILRFHLSTHTHAYTHTQRLEGLDSKIRVFHSRREAGVSRPTSDRDSPFTPMAAEIPASRGATPRLLPRPDHEDNLLLNTPLSSPPDSSIEDSKVPGPSLNRGNIQVNRHWYMR